MHRFLRFAKLPTFHNLLFLTLFTLVACPLRAAVTGDSTASTLDTPTISPPVTEKSLADYGLQPLKVTAIATLSDAGGVINISWNTPGLDSLPGLTGFVILRKDVNSGKVDSIAALGAGARSYVDSEIPDDNLYAYLLAVLVDGTKIVSAATPPVGSPKPWFNKRLTAVLIIGIIICGAVVFYIETAKRGKKLFLRRIAGLEAVDEAVGRATEMGKPILFIAGIRDMDDVQTIAGLTILGRIARTIAEYDTKIHMPVCTSLVMTAGRETIKQAYVAAGRPDAYNDDMVHYVTDEQFGFVAAVDGIMVRERPAACFFLGAFFAESLIMAETGNSIKAIQIAGTAMPAQLPFFVAACDYTLIGEELFAASAYLSGEPRQLGSLKGQDIGKAISLLAILVGVIATTFATAWNWEWMRWLENLMQQAFTSN